MYDAPRLVSLPTASGGLCKRPDHFQRKSTVTGKTQELRETKINKYNRPNGTHGGDASRGKRSADLKSRDGSKGSARRCLQQLLAQSKHSANPNCVRRSKDDKGRHRKQHTWAGWNVTTSGRGERQSRALHAQAGGERQQRREEKRPHLWGRGKGEGGLKGTRTNPLYQNQTAAQGRCSSPSYISNPRALGLSHTGSFHCLFPAIYLCMHTYFHRSHHSLRRSGAYNRLKFLLKEIKFKCQRSRTFTQKKQHFTYGLEK